MKKDNEKIFWDYKINKGWQPKTDRQWLWYLERKINYDDWQGLKAEIIKEDEKRTLLQTYQAGCYKNHFSPTDIFSFLIRSDSSNDKLRTPICNVFCVIS